MKKILCYLKALVLSVVAFFLQTHGKRIVLLTTLHMQLTQLHDFNQEKMSQLNESLKLCRTEDALVFPCYLNKAVWGEGIPATQVCSINNNDATCSYILSLIPDWLRYDRSTMAMDIKKVLENAKIISGGQFA